jgi:hypothetical protein
LSVEPLNARRLCPVCGAVKMGRLCLRCRSFAVDTKDHSKEYAQSLAKYQASRASRRFRPMVEAPEGGRARLRGQPGDRHRKGGVPYDPTILHDTYGRENE